MAEHVTAGERVACWFKIRGWSIGEASRRTGLHKQKLWRIVAGKQEPRPSDIAPIVEALGVTEPEFYGGFNDKPVAEAAG